MAVPKQRKGRSATNTRRSANDKIKVAGKSTCSQCGEPKLQHHVCPNCGYYNKREILDVE